MNAQFKKGVLDLILLYTLKHTAKTTYDVLVDLREAMDVNENTIYPLLRRLESEGYITHEKIQGDMGAPRKVFLLTETGIKHLESLHQDWNKFYIQVNHLLGGLKDE
ncbi:PadR family transcriptional regulator [Liberiplasma polymorphum]|uniref:PadR family transcriptional regulator n=1 Tax=Liberiplasma polymorphum TaxID=3374570 RepID=UPI003772CDBB